MEKGKTENKNKKTNYIYPKYSHRQVWENSVDPDQLLQMNADDQDVLCLTLIQLFLGSKTDIQILTLVLLNPDVPHICKRYRSESVGFSRS